MDLLSEESLAYTSPSDAAQDGALTSAQCAELIRSLDPTKPEPTVMAYVRRSAAPAAYVLF